MPNKLIHETSPYLLQHANNPVEWYPWGNEALQKAIDEHKPILVSIGYSACHWCHVMEHESFEDEETAAIMNKYFINIKVDREERPDIDHIYMDAVQAMTGSGGWPLNVFLLPDKRPFYGGTYFPPRRMYNRNSWKDVLLGISRAYSERKREIENQAENITQHLPSANTFGVNKTAVQDELFAEKTLQAIAENLLAHEDAEWGGFGNAPKFPQTMSITFLLRHYHFTKHQPSLDCALLSLDKMYMGGLYDHAGGGFARYSTDKKWQVPHFEKMLYDNALLLSTYAEAYQLTKKKEYAAIIEKTIAFTEREMLSPQGGFYAALDADSEGEEGKYYVWDKKEIDELLGGEDSRIFCKVFDVKEAGNWEHTNVLWMPVALPSVAESLNIPLEELAVKVEYLSSVLLKERNKRIRPGLDDKILLGWNGLMITALCKCYAALGNSRYLHLAENAIGFIEENMKGDDGRFAHSYKEKRHIQYAFLDDYASLLEAYIHLQEVTGKQEYLIRARFLTEFVMTNFDDEGSSLFFYTQEDQQDVIIRKKEVYDGATPSGNAQMSFVLSYLSGVFGIQDWMEHARLMLKEAGGSIIKYPSSFAYWAAVLYRLVLPVYEIAITGNHYRPLLKELLNEYIPHRVLQSAEGANDLFPLLKGKTAATDETLIYLCTDYACRQPVKTVKELLESMNK